MGKYSLEKAESYWGNRVNEVDPTRAVLSYSLPEKINQAYDTWEWHSLMWAIYDDVKEKKILDVGGGWGRVSCRLQSLNGYVVLVDNSSEMVKRATENGIYSVKSPSSDMNITSGEFDIVICLGLLEHLPTDERKKTHAEIKRVLKTNGMAIFVINNNESIFLKKRGLYSEIEQYDNGYYNNLVGVNELRNTYKTVDVVSSNLFHSIAWRYLKFLPASWHKWIASKDAEWGAKKLDRRLADQFLVRCRL